MVFWKKTVVDTVTGIWQKHSSLCCAAFVVLFA